MACVGLVHRDPCGCKIKGFCAVSSIERNVSKKHLCDGPRPYSIARPYTRLQLT